MASTDRAFRALARASPHAIVALVRRLAPALVAAPDHEIVALDDPHVDVPPHPREADFVATVGAPGVLHVECQGYRDPEFSERVFGYHLALTLRHPSRRVRTCAIWLRAPAADQRATEVRRGDVTIALTTLVLCELDAAALLESDETACFAPAAELGAMTIEDLCDRVVAALARVGAHPRERAMAAVAAATRGRYPFLVRAMEKAAMEPVIIEDLVDYGYEQGLAEGIEKGIERGIDEGQRRATVAAILDLLDARGLSASIAQRTRIAEERDVERLRGWLRRVIDATSVDDVIRDTQ
jgi:hypothetical protein